MVSTASAVSYGMTSVGIQAIVTPRGNCTRTGRVNELARLPSPSWPSVPSPQAYRRPSVSSAYWVELDVPTSATLPGTASRVGEVSVSKLPCRPPKNDPQCSTVEVTAGPGAGRWPAEQPVLPATAASTAASPPRTGHRLLCRTRAAGRPNAIPGQ